MNIKVFSYLILTTVFSLTALAMEHSKISDLNQRINDFQIDDLPTVEEIEMMNELARMSRELKNQQPPRRDDSLASKIYYLNQEGD